MSYTSNPSSPVPASFVTQLVKYSKLSLLLLIPLVVILLFLTVED